MPTTVIHNVYFWLTPDLDEADRRAFLTATKGLSDAPTVQKCLVGRPATTPARDVTDKSFDYHLQLHFASVADHDAYQVSDVHLGYVAAQEHKFATVRVYDTHLL